MATKRKYDEAGFQEWLKEVYEWINKIHDIDLGNISSANKEYLLECYEDGDQAIDIALEFDPKRSIEPE